MKKLEYDKDFLKKSNARIASNKFIANYYREKGLNEYDDALFKKAKSLELCLKFWDVDYFRMQAVKDVKRVNACKDMFCQNCQHNLSLKRFAKYSPVLDSLLENYDIYHVVFTVPSCSGIALKDTLNKMYKKFVYINQYFIGARDSKAFDFKQFGYVGAVRSLEVTYRKRKGLIEYHPHFHCLFVMKKDLDFEKVEFNRFSYSRKSNEVKAFSQFEIFLQKFWKLLYTDKRFNAKNFNALKIGYSCKCDKCCKGDYHEVFKYALGGLFKKDFDLTFEVFNSMYNGLHRRKIIQGYGILNKFEFDAETDDEVIKEYFAYREKLELLEAPTFEAVKLENILQDMKAGIKYISKFRKTYDNKEISDDKELSEAVKRLDALQSRFEEGKIYTYKLQASCCQVVIVKKYFKYCKVRIKHVDYDNADNYYTLLQKQARSFSVGYELLSDCYGK